MNNNRSNPLGITSLLTSFTLLTTTSQAAVVVVDPVDSANVQIEVNGITTQASLFQQASSSTLSFTALPGLVGIESSGVGYTGGESLTPTSRRSGHTYRFNSFFTNGADAGLNYLRLDMDANGVFETVVEIDLGPNPDLAGDVVTRYAFDDTGASLDIPDAFNNIPEPGATTLTFFGLVSLLTKRRRK